MTNDNDSTMFKLAVRRLEKIEKFLHEDRVINEENHDSLDDSLGKIDIELEIVSKQLENIEHRLSSLEAAGRVSFEPTSGGIEVGVNPRPRNK